MAEVSVLGKDGGIALTEAWLRRELTPWQQQRRRWELHSWRAQFSGWLGARSAGACQKAMSGDHVQVLISSRGRPYVRSVYRCGSLWSCPVCTPSARQAKGRDIQAAVEAWQALGGEVWFCTYTVSHSAGESLLDTRTRVQSWYSELWAGKGGRLRRERHGIEGQIRVLEVTHGRHGWHPHIHTLFFCRAGEFDVKAAADEWAARWDAHGAGDQFVRRVSFDARKVQAGDRGSGVYLAKVEQTWGIGAEAARADLKATGGGVTAPQMIELAACGDARAIRLWQEWEIGMKGATAIVWSRGLRNQAAEWQAFARSLGAELLGVDLGEPELSDQEAAAGELAENDEVVAAWVVPRRTWDLARRSHLVGVLLQALVRGEGEQWGCRLIRADWGTVDPPAFARSRGDPVELLASG